MEISCPVCKYSRTVADDSVPANSVNATCPQCNAKFRFRELGVAAEATAAPLASVPQAEQAPAEPQAPPAPAPAQPAPPADALPVRNLGSLENDTPPPAASPRNEAGTDDIWQRLDSMGDSRPEGEGVASGYTPDGETIIPVPFEELERYGFFGGLFETCKRSVLAPRLFFETMPVNNGYGRPIVFYMLLNMLAVLLQLAVEFSLHGVQIPSGTDLPPGAEGITAGAGIAASFLFVFIAGPPILTLFLYGISSILHLILTPLQAVSGGFQGTVRAVSYAALPSLCMVIPIAGMYIGTVWSIVLLIYALHGVHKTSFTKAGLTVGIYTAAGIAFVMYLTQAMGMPGPAMGM